MSKVDEIVAALEDGQSIEEVRAKYSGSKGPLYTAIAKATEIAVGKFEDARAELQEINTRTAQGRERLEGLKRDTKAEENRNAEIRRANQETSRILGETRSQLEAKKKLLKLFRAMKITPAEALEVIGKIRDLRREFAVLNAAAIEKEKELTGFETQIPAMKEDYLGWQRRRDIERGKVWDLASQAGHLSERAGQLFPYVEGLKVEATTLEGVCSATRQTRDTLVSEIQGLRKKRPKLIFINEGLNADIAAQRVEIVRLAEVSKAMLVAIAGMGQKITQVLNAEVERELRVDREFATKITVLRMTHDRLIEQSEAKLEELLRERVSERVRNLPVLEGRAAELEVRVMALGVQVTDRIAELEKFEKSIVACPKGYVIGVS